METKRLKRIFLAGYTLVILYFMFVGFGRISRFDAFQFNFTITGIPLWIPKQFTLGPLQIWIFALGNLVAFIPFGVLIPLNLRTTSNLFLKSFTIFMIGITALESIQMISLLGSFDIEDILINTVGFVIGYASWKFSKQKTKLSNQIFRFCTMCNVLIFLTIVGAEFTNSFLR